MKRISIVALFVLGALVACNSPKRESETKGNEDIPAPTNHVVLSSEIIWEKLNPARGDQSPQAGTLWGDRKGTVATGFLAKFVDGFSSPPHIHNITYRAVVIEGAIHNDDPAAEHMWMKPGSFWTQPEGEAHITAAKGKENIAYVEIDKGPYLVQAADKAYDNGERPINLDASNIVWLDSRETNWIREKSSAQLSFLWESTEPEGSRGSFLKLPGAYQGSILSEGEAFHAVVIKGEMDYEMPLSKELMTLDQGSYFTSSAKAIHSISNGSEKEVVLYIRSRGTLKID